ncbi:hypothetical protein K3495_g2424 [Podosphaera aphanis]|nr:hypothetical protein K3495_g2424 [Podosphaera aphanis]
MKTCSKHGKKLALPEPEKDQWDEFMFEINEWSQPGQTSRLDLSYTFDIHQLPVSFDFLSETDVTHIEDYGPLNQVVSQLTELIREAGGHRFRQRFMSKKKQVSSIIIVALRI